MQAPQPNTGELAQLNNDLKRAFEREVSGALEKIELEHPIRQKRQSELGMDTVEEIDINPQAEKPGFLDRAAKVLMELLQRFLKWINTDDQN